MIMTLGIPTFFATFSADQMDGPAIITVQESSWQSTNRNRAVKSLIHG